MWGDLFDENTQRGLCYAFQKNGNIDIHITTALNLLDPLMHKSASQMSRSQHRVPGSVFQEYQIILSQRIHKKWLATGNTRKMSNRRCNLQNQVQLELQRHLFCGTSLQSAKCDHDVKILRREQQSFPSPFIWWKENIVTRGGTGSCIAIPCKVGHTYSRLSKLNAIETKERKAATTRIRLNSVHNI